MDTKKSIARIESKIRTRKKSQVWRSDFRRSKIKRRICVITYFVSFGLLICSCFVSSHLFYVGDWVWYVVGFHIAIVSIVLFYLYRLDVIPIFYETTVQSFEGLLSFLQNSDDLFITSEQCCADIIQIKKALEKKNSGEYKKWEYDGTDFELVQRIATSYYVVWHIVPFLVLGQYNLCGDFFFLLYVMWAVGIFGI